MKIAYFGGTFNPIHMGHLLMSSYAYEKLSLDCLYFMPAENPPHKFEKKIADISHRNRMIELAIENDSRFELSKADQNKDISYTYEVLTKIEKERSKDEIFFLMGADSLWSIRTWYKYRDILEKYELIVVVRHGMDMPDLTEFRESLQPFKGIHLLDMPLIEISSSAIRRRRKVKKSIKYFLPYSVENYIKEHSLYAE